MNCIQESWLYPRFEQFQTKTDFKQMFLPYLLHAIVHTTFRHPVQ